MKKKKNKNVEPTTANSHFCYFYISWTFGLAIRFFQSDRTGSFPQLWTFQQRFSGTTQQDMKLNPRGQETTHSCCMYRNFGVVVFPKFTNRITYTHDCSNSKVSHLGLYLHDCGLTTISVDALAPLNSTLRYLWLNGNQLESLDKKMASILGVSIFSFVI